MRSSDVPSVPADELSTSRRSGDERPAPRPAQPLRLKTYKAWTMAEALSFAKRDLGEDAVILHTRTFERGGFFGFGRKVVVEITAARAADLASSEPRRAVPATRGEGRSESRIDRLVEPKIVVEQGRADAARPASGDRVRAATAARAYVAASRDERIDDVVGDARPVPASHVASRAERIDGVVGGGADVVDRADSGVAIDMSAEREKTRRLAQAMLERFDREAAAATRNERATEAALEARPPTPPAPAPAPATPRLLWPRIGAPASSPAALSSQGPASEVASASPPTGAAPQRASQPASDAGPAQRFVLMPEPAAPGVAGTGTLAAAVIRIGGPESEVGGAVPESRGAGSESRGAGSESRGNGPASATSLAAADAGPSEAASRVASTSNLSASAAPSPPPASPSAPWNADGRAASELDTISSFVGAVLGRSPGGPVVHARSSWRLASLEQAYAHLIEQEVAKDLAARIVRDVESEFGAAIDSGAEVSQKVVREAVERRIAAILPADENDAFRVQPGRQGARRIAFIGPTGVGKTTTLAKIAAQYRLKRGCSVGIVAADTYRIAAVDQLRTYAEILGIPLEVAASPADARRACESLAECDVILIDTAGRSQNDRMKLSELRAFLAAAEPDETHLVLSATAGARALAREAEAFGALGVDRVALTKLDEAACFGTLVSLVEALGKRLSYMTHGQEVPEHIEPGRGRRLAALVMGSEVR